MENNQKTIYTSERPTIITVLCGYFFVSWILTIINLLVLFFSANSGFTSSINVVSWTFLFTLLSIIAVFGYWFMSKWAVYLYIVVTIASLVYEFINSHGYSFSSGVLFSLIISLVIPISLIYVGVKYFGQMS